MNGGAVTIRYDGFGNRVVETAGGVTTRFLVEDDVNPTGLPQVFDELTGSVVTRTYTYGLQRINEDQNIRGTWTPSFYGYDGGGSVRQLTSLAAAVTDTYNYDAFGNLLNSTGSTPNNYLYRGEQYDQNLNLYYLRARYYNPIIGRFMSRDPTDGQINIPATLHKYLYSSGDPVNAIDPTGRAAYIESIFSEPIVISSPLEISVEEADYSVAKAFCAVAKLLASVPWPGAMPGPGGIPMWPWKPLPAICDSFF